MMRDVLLNGVHSSLRTAEVRLREACLLYENGFFSGATILARFGQEELGRSVALYRLYVDSSSETAISMETIAKLGDHRDRLRLGRFGSFLRAPASVNREIQNALASGSAEQVADARKPLDEVHQIKSRRQPDDLQKLRERAQYVDPVSDDSWNRPWAISQATAHEVLTEAIAHLFSHWTQLVQSSPLMAVWQTLPESERPSYPPRLRIPALPTGPADNNRDHG
jgi:AbiV family abortive infection protein